MYFKMTSRGCYYWAIGTGLDFEGDRCYVGCTDYEGYTEVVWFSLENGYIVPIKDFPKRVKKKFRKYVENPFFEIDLRRYMEKEGVSGYKSLGGLEIL